MMMANTNTEKEEEAPSFATPAPQLSSVADLERRLKILDNAEAPAPTPTTAPAAAPAAADTKPAATMATPSKGGKTALLARIKAAKEKSLQAQTKAEPIKTKQEPVDMLSAFDAPAKASDPPPAYDTNFLPPPPAESAPSLLDVPPPTFDASAVAGQQQMSFPPPPPIGAMAPPPALGNVMPPPPAIPSAPAASAPSFEDLLGNQQSMPPPPAGSLMDMPAVPPPPVAAPSAGIDEDILAALDPAERDAILEEQRKIMEQIEKEKANNNASSAAARAMAFDQRSSAAVAQVASQYDDRPRAPAARPKPKSSSNSSSRIHASSAGGRTVDLGDGEEVPLHGQERTQAAIKEGNALIVQCLNCQNWMQVTKDATLMFCPTCQVVSPVLTEAAATSEDMEAAAQMAADAQLAEKLQAEEYGRAEGARKKAQPKKKSAKLEKGQAVEQSWYDWFMGTPTQPPPPTHGSAEIRPRGLVAASTGQESYGNSRSYDESEGLLNRGGGGARVAESKGMFACVADAVGTAATTMYTINQDNEGNVHGVDASGLLAMPDVSRQRE